MKLPSRATPIAAALAAIALAPAAACARSAAVGFDPDAGAGADAGTVEGGSAGTDDGSNLVGDGTSADAPSCAVRCSPDLHEVTDCETPPHVIATCPPDQGCGPNFQCIPACDSAAANKSTIGCDYYSIPADGYSYLPDLGQNGGADGSCFAAFVTNTWGVPLHVSLEYAGQKVDGTSYAYLPQGTGANISYVPITTTGGAIQPNQVAIIFLSQYGGLTDDAGSPLQNKILCPPGVQAAFTTQDVGTHGTALGNAIHLSTDYPAVVYDIYPYGGAASFISSATLLLPTSVWDTNYVAVTAWPGFTLAGTLQFPSNLAIVAMQDGTSVQILPREPIAARGSVAGGPASQPISYSLSKGQVLQLAQVRDLSGSPIQANNPVGLWGGHYCMMLPSASDPACDAAHQQIPPVKALGSSYAAVPYRSRVSDDEIVPWRIMGMVQNTQLTFDPPVAGAPSTLQVGDIVEVNATGPFVVRSQDDQHPFYLAAHMTGGTLATDGTTGDPETVNVVPPEQYLPSYVFFTDPTYSETNLVLVRDKAPDGKYADVTLDCLTSPISGWSAIGSSTLEYARVDVQHQHAAVGSCDNGPHTIHSDAPFGITVWGFDKYVSYAYPAGASVRSINQVVVPVTQ
jgi:hypothetical protein